MRIPSERIIFDEEIPRPSKTQPRYIPAAILDQVNSYLGDLKAPWMQMVLILQECGMRISELLQLPLDCLTQDARGAARSKYLQVADPAQPVNKLPVNASRNPAPWHELSKMGMTRELERRVGTAYRSRDLTLS